jgi:hypothetical protein
MKNLTLLIFILFFAACEQPAKIVEDQGYTLDIDTVFQYKVEFKDGSRRVITRSSRYKENDVIPVF